MKAAEEWVELLKEKDPLWDLLVATHGEALKRIIVMVQQDARFSELQSFAEQMSMVGNGMVAFSNKRLVEFQEELKRAL